MQFKVATLRRPEPGFRGKINQKYPRGGEKQSLVFSLQSGVKVVVVETVITGHSKNAPWVPQLGGARIQLIIHMLQVELSNSVIDAHWYSQY